MPDIDKLIDHFIGFDGFHREKLNSLDTKKNTLKEVEAEEKEANKLRISYKNQLDQTVKELDEEIKLASNSRYVGLLKDLKNHCMESFKDFNELLKEHPVFKTEKEKQLMRVKENKELKEAYKAKRKDKDRKITYLKDHSVIEGLLKVEKEGSAKFDTKVNEAKKSLENAKANIDVLFKGVENSPVYSQKERDKSLKETKSSLTNLEKKREALLESEKTNSKKLLKTFNKGRKGGDQFTNGDLDIFSDSNSLIKKVYKKLSEKERNKVDTILNSQQSNQKDLDQIDKHIANDKKTLEALNATKDEYIKAYKEAAKNLAKALGEREKQVNKSINTLDNKTKNIIKNEKNKIDNINKGGIFKAGKDSLESKLKATQEKKKTLEERKWDITGISKWRAKSLTKDENKLNERIAKRQNEIDARQEKINKAREVRVDLKTRKVGNQKYIGVLLKEEGVKKALSREPNLPKNLISDGKEPILDEVKDFAIRMKESFSRKREKVSNTLNDILDVNSKGKGHSR